MHDIVWKRAREVDCIELVEHGILCNSILRSASRVRIECFVWKCLCRNSSVCRIVAKRQLIRIMIEGGGFGPTFRCLQWAIDMVSRVDALNCTESTMVIGSMPRYPHRLCNCRQVGGDKNEV